MYEEFYESLENKHNEKWTWDRDTKTTAQGLFTATRSFEHIMSFSVVFNALELIKPLVTKLQKRNQDIYTAYQMIESVLREWKNYRDDIDNEFQHWHDLAVRICKNVDIEPGLPRLAKCWSRYRPDIENDIVLQENRSNTIFGWHKLPAKWEAERPKLCGDMEALMVKVALKNVRKINRKTAVMALPQLFSSGFRKLFPDCRKFCCTISRISVHS